MEEFQIASHEIDPQYYGVHFGNDKTGYRKCRLPVLNDHIFSHPPSVAESLKKLLQLPNPGTFVKNQPRVRCPCPLLPTTEKPEDRTIGPDQLHGRMFHGAHMSFAWMVWIPVAIFVARYFKETFSNVFCLQEYWWYMFHIFFLVGGLVFMIGGNLSVIAKESLLKPADTKEMFVHRLLGWISWGLFIFQLVSGVFRHKNPQKRFWQMVVHHGLGMFNITTSIMCMGLVANVGGSCMTCRGALLYGCWIMFNVGIIGIMECHMVGADEELDLDPPRTRCPIHYKRMFGQDAPGRNFRMAMLLIYLLGISGMWWGVRTTIWGSEGLSCRDYWQGKTSLIGQVIDVNTTSINV